MLLAPRRSSRPPSTGSSPLNSGLQERHQGPADYSQWANLSYDTNMAPPWEGFPAAVPVCHSFDTLAQPTLWTEPDLSFDADWNFLSLNQHTPYPATFDDIPTVDVGYDTPTFNSLSDSGSIDHQNFMSASLAASSANSGRIRGPLSPDLLLTFTRWSLAAFTCITIPRPRLDFYRQPCHLPGRCFESR